MCQLYLFDLYLVYDVKLFMVSMSKPFKKRQETFPLHPEMFLLIQSRDCLTRTVELEVE